MIRSAVPGWVPAAAAAVGAAAGCAVLAVADPRGGPYPVCPFYAATGMFCPGCGTLRAAHSAFGGDLAGAWAYNPLAVVCVPVVVYAWFRWVLQSTGRGLRMPRASFGRYGPVLFAVVVVAYTAARNAPRFSALAPV